MRHPMYVAESGFWLGIIVLFGSPVVAAVFICLAGMAMTWIIPKEEKALEEQFGEEYIIYRNHVPSTLRFGRRR
jgi:protein-S-isoprenylcysteine O-methyltransferase Ste14